MVRAYGQELAVRSHDLGGEHVVARKPELAVEPADAAAEGQTGDAGHRNHSERSCQSIRLGGTVEVGQKRSGFSQGCPAVRINPDVPHARAVHHERPLAHGVARDIVAAAFDGDRKVVIPCEVHGVADVVSLCRTDYDCRAAVDHRIEDLPCLVVTRFPGEHQLSPEGRTQTVYERWRRRLDSHSYPLRGPGHRSVWRCRTVGALSRRSARSLSTGRRKACPGPTGCPAR